MKYPFSLLVCAALVILSGCFKEPVDPATNTGGNTNQPHTYDWSTIADSAQTGLTANFWNSTGHFFTMQIGQGAFNYNYWPNAHGLDALTDAYLRKNKPAAVK